MWNAFEAGEKTGKRLAARSPRAAGLVGIGGACVLLGINVVTIRTMNVYYPSAAFIGCAVLPLGGWILVTGRTEKTPDNPTWWKAGYYAALALGVGVGGYLAFVAEW